MEYYLMRKDDVVTLCNISDDGRMINYSDRFRNPELAPLGFRTSRDYLVRWWENRQIPVNSDRIREMLLQKGFDSEGEYLIKNLGLSLTDYYWMKPVDSALKWKDVNLFENDFRDNLLMPEREGKEAFNSYSPNSSLKGELEKSWIIKDGKRMLVKGNPGRSSQESINEVIASEFHKKQGYDNYTDYSLLKIKGKRYDYGCLSESFTDSSMELVSAHAVLTSEAKPDGMSPYEFLIELAVKHGIDGDELRRDLEYQIVSDYALTNVDRHMENVGILRDADTLKFIRMAPIFDTGRAFNTGAVIPYTDDEIDNVELNSFERNEKDLLALVTDRSAVDLSRVLDEGKIEALCKKDSRADDFRINSIVRLYSEKLARLRKWQEG